MNVTVGSSCNALPAPGACGGALSGRYCYTAFCVDEARILVDVQSACSSAGGTVTFTNTSGTVNGSVEFSGGFVTRDATLTINGTATIPPACAVAGCATVQAAFGAAGATANCAASSGGCSCTYTVMVPTGTAQAYSTAGSTISIGSSSYEYCAQSGLLYRETTAKPAEPGFATLSR